MHRNVVTCYEENNEHKYIGQKSDAHSTCTTTILLVSTLAVTTVATGTSCISLMTDYWEYITWNTQKIYDIGSELGASEKYQRRTISTEPVLDDLITKVSIYDQNISAGVFFVPMHGGIWTLCISLNDEQLTLLQAIDFPTKLCVNYLSTKLFKEEPSYTTDWNNRMQNVSISCALVCLILLGCAAFIGTLGILKHQLSAILVTGVMYLLAGTFALFTIMIAHFKKIDCRRNHQNSNGMNIDNKSVILDDGIIQQIINNEIHSEFNNMWIQYYRAREFNIGWSFDVGMTGVALSLLTSLLWILMAKILRYTPIVIQF